MDFKTIVKEIKTQGRPIVFMCIGTDKHVWDSVGPITGSLLEEMNILSYGDLNNPITAINVEQIEKNIKRVYSDHIIIVIDASITDDISKHETIEITRGGIKPGNGVGKNIKRVGDYSLLYNVFIDKVEDKKIRNPYNGAKRIVSFIEESLI